MAFGIPGGVGYHPGDVFRAWGIVQAWQSPAEALADSSGIAPLRNFALTRHRSDWSFALEFVSWCHALSLGGQSDFAGKHLRVSNMQF